MQRVFPESSLVPPFACIFTGYGTSDRTAKEDRAAIRTDRMIISMAAPLLLNYSAPSFPNDLNKTNVEAAATSAMITPATMLP